MKEVTYEEMAEKYAKGLCKTCKVDVCRYSKIQTCTTKESLKQAYLAGLKAGRPQWHKVADGDYPPYDKCNCSINVFTNSGHIAYYNYDDKCWIEVFSVIEINPPIAWCEIPKYTEE